QEPNQMKCPTGDYLSKNNICCNKCNPGYKLVKECPDAGHRSNCTSCPKDQYMDQINYNPNCFRCKVCRKHEVEESPCKRDKNTVCVCKAGYYKSEIDPTAFECLKCSKCRPDEKEKQTCTRDANTVCVCKDGHYREKNTCKPCEGHVNFLLQERLFVHEESSESQVESVPQTPVEEQGQPNLPDCVPLEIRIPDLIYTVLDLVPVVRVKELVRSLGVRDTVIEQAEIDHRQCREAHYQMLRVWAENGSHAAGGGRGDMLHLSLVKELLDKLRQMHLGGTAEELETKYGIH
uniref:Tumor necrosis factor receptor superfamily, member 1a n=1 Tax=Oryzias latipes TaxID=8090 RepID=A0A3P9HRA0_ORYLA